MLLIIAAAVAVSAPQGASFTRVGATAQARATVRIISAVTLRLGEGPIRGEAPLARIATVHDADGASHAASLIEFQ